MADTKISDLTAITGPGTASGDLFLVVDVSDTTMAASGTDKKITKAEMLTIFEAAGAAAAAQAASQPVDSDLTAIAALSTTTYGRAILTLANQAALMALLSASSDTAQGIVELATNAETSTGTDATRAVTPAGLASVLSSYLTTAAAAAGYQPLDSDLTAIAALTTTTFGRSLLALADAAAGRTSLGLVIGTNVQAFDQDLADIAGIARNKGDLIVGGSSAWLDLAVGTDGQVLTADAASSGGVKWATASGGDANVPAVNTSLGSAAPGMVRLSYANSMVTLTSGVTYYTGPFELDAAAALTGFQFKIDALTGTAKLRIALVSVDPVDLQPLALTYADAEQTYTTTGEKTPTFSSQSIPAGVYYVAFRTDNSTLAHTGMRMGPASGWRGTEEGYITASHFTVSEAYGAFSSPPTDWTASVKVSTTGTTGLLVPITWVVS